MLRTMLTVSFCLFAFNAFAADKKPAAQVAPTVVTFEAKMEGTNKTWLPMKTTVKADHPVVAKVVNTFLEPHGFEIPGIVKTEIMANETREIPLVGLKKGTYDIKCHLHPKHVGAKLVVE